MPPIDVLCGGFPCQDVSTVGKQGGLAPGTRSGLWSFMATAIEALQPELVVIENVRGLLSAPAIRPQTEGDSDADCNPDDATPARATPGGLESDAWVLGDESARPLRALGAGMSTWPTSGMTRNGSAYPHPWPEHHITGSASSSPRTAKTLFRTPLASNSSRGGESLDTVKARRGTIALSHQIIDFALHGPHGSPIRQNASETLFTLIENVFANGEATPTPSLGGNTSPDDQHQPRRS